MGIKIFNFPGGLKLPEHKKESTGLPIAPAPLPDYIVLPLRQHIGGAAIPVVEVGDKVKRGQVVARAQGYVSAPVHSTISGHVAAVGDFPIAHPSGLSAPCIVIHSDGQDEGITGEPTDWRNEDASHLRNIIREAGIVGLGGAAFPSFIKLNPGPGKKVDTFIVNGAECEPYITCDDMLMRERAAQIFQGIDIAMHALQAGRCIIGIEDNKPQAIAAMRAALQATGRDDIDIGVVPSRYPQGGEKQLIFALTGLEVPSNGLPLDVGVVCHNPGTLYAIHRAIHHGEPLTSRIMTVSGKGVAQPQNLEVRLGTPVREVIGAAGGYNRDISRLVMGGPMMGFALHTDKAPVVKATNCILVEPHEVNDEDAMPCIRCGECVEVCPAQLLPQQLHWFAKTKQFDKAQDHALFDCIECGCCAQVCPSHIPLVQHYRFAKSEIWAEEREKRKADHARDRFEFREERIEREIAEKKAKAEARKAALRKVDEPAEQKDSAAAAGSEDKHRPAIAAVLARVQNKKQDAGQTAQTEQQTQAPDQVANPTTDQDTEEKDMNRQQGSNQAGNPLSAAQAAIARAKASKGIPDDGNQAPVAEATTSAPRAKKDATVEALLKSLAAEGVTADRAVVEKEVSALRAKLVAQFSTKAAPAPSKNDEKKATEPEALARIKALQAKRRAQKLAQEAGIEYDPTVDAVACPPLQRIEILRKKRGLELHTDVRSLTLTATERAKLNLEQEYAEAGYQPTEDAIACPPLQRVELLRKKRDLPLHSDTRSLTLKNNAEEAKAEEPKSDAPAADVAVEAEQKTEKPVTGALAAIRAAQKNAGVEAAATDSAPAEETRKEKPAAKPASAALAAIRRAQQGAGVEAQDDASSDSAPAAEAAPATEKPASKPASSAALAAIARAKAAKK